MLHATSEEEYQQIRAKGITAPVAVIPNGIDIPQMPADVGEVRGTSQMRTLLFLSRIHPTKALDRLLKAWSRLEELHPTWKLRIVGKGDAAHVEEVHSLASELGVKRVEFSGPLYGAEKSMAYWQANLFVLPTHSENFGMAVAEALAHGCPAIVGKGAPWEGLELEQCGWWVANDVDTLAATLHEAMGTSSASLVEMGKRGRAWMARDYNWEVIGQDMAAAYRWLITGANRPKCVRLS
jgi:glycosyltransferase involved in cell wall biosynthesis